MVGNVNGVGGVQTVGVRHQVPVNQADGMQTILYVTAVINREIR